MLIVNGDDLGLTVEATNNTVLCFQRGLITSASAMVFMSDSERAAESAKTVRLESGLHLNLSLPFNVPDLLPQLRKYQRRIVNYLSLGKWTQVFYNPLLKNEFRYVFKAQYDEYCRLFGREPAHIDGHHHTHLCMNMLVDQIIPRGMRVRRNFTFMRGEKSFSNRLYRRLIDAWLIRRYICADAFFSIDPTQDLNRLKRIIRMALSRDVELMVHPGIREHYECLKSAEYRALIQDIPMGTYRMLLKSLG